MTDHDVDNDAGDDLDDLAAELDDDDTTGAAQQADTDADDPDPLHQHAGLVEGGPVPYAGRLLVSRYPRGVLLLDKPGDRAWVLDFDAAGGIYRCRDDSGAPIDAAGRWRAAEGPDFEVRAFDPEFGGDDPPGQGPAAGGGRDYEVVPA